MATFFDVNIQLRRDNDYNYSRIADTFIPRNGEPCLVDTARNGLRIKIGDGNTPFKNLEYVDSFLLKGYYLNQQFYKNADKTEIYIPNDNKLYLDILTYQIYFYNGKEYQGISSYIRGANESTVGIMKLYKTTGSNEDGTMTQKAITDELNTKVELTLNEEEEKIIFSL